MSDIFSYVQEQEAGYKQPIYLDEQWSWSMREHIRRSYLYKNTQFFDKNSDRKLKPFINIVRPILNIHYRTEGFDVKDIEIYVDNVETYYKSFLVKKFHDKWALENMMDTFLDDLVESYVDYGGVLVKNVNTIRPEVVDLRTLAFCDQTDLMGSPFAIKHYYRPEDLMKEEKRGWGDTNKGATISLENLVAKAEAHKDVLSKDLKNKTPGQYLEVYELHNCSESDYVAGGETATYMTILAFYKDESGKQNGVILYKSKEPKDMFKFLKRDNVQGRALGFGAIEELFEAQRWTNFTEIVELQMLQQASKILYLSDDPKFKGQNLSGKKMGEVLNLQENRTVQQLDSTPRSINSFENRGERYKQHASEMGAASDLFLGQQPTAGTPFKSVESQLIEGKSLHLWRQGRIAVFVDEIYRDWIIPHIGKEVSKGTKFLSELSMEEVRTVADRVMDKYANDWVKKRILSGKIVYPFEVQSVRQMAEETVLKLGNKRFIEIMKGEFEKEKLDVRTNIAGKQKNLALLTDKLVNVIRQFIATPEIRQDEGMVRLLNQTLEASGLSPLQYFPRTQPVASEEGAQSTEGLKQLGASAQKQGRMQTTGV